MNGLQFNARHRYASGFELNAQFETDRGVTALFGPSGAGKSTCLGIIAGILRPQAGRLRWATPVVDTAGKVFLPPEKRSVGMIFQEQRLFPHLTVADNLRFGRRRRKSTRIDFDKLVEILELGGLLNRYPRQLSGGQQQRVAVGRGILRDPALLLMDEPLAALDQDLKERVLDLSWSGHWLNGGFRRCSSVTIRPTCDGWPNASSCSKRARWSMPAPPSPHSTRP